MQLFENHIQIIQLFAIRSTLSLDFVRVYIAITSNFGIAYGIAYEIIKK